jgi:hydroxymethylpyrimidine/phosphomethylpyrimidine kinase
VLAIGGHDPSGGAGIQADIEAILANGAHATTVVSCLTVQDSCNLSSLHPVAPEVIAAQVDTLLADHPVSAIKIGLIGSPEVAEYLLSLLQAQQEIPVVLDPVLAAGGGNPVAGEKIVQRVRQMLPLCDLITPNTLEAHKLSGLEEVGDSQSCAKKLLSLGANSVLITGTHEAIDEEEISHRLWQQDRDEATWHCARLSGEYHGSGCTLASAIATHLAKGEDMSKAVDSALDYSWQSLRHGFRTGQCQALPDRLYSLKRFGVSSNE